MDKLELKGKWAVITGASSGIGQATAETLAKQRVNLVLMSRSLDKLETLATNLKRQYSIQVNCYNVDVRNASQVQEALSRCLEHHAIDILINNAGLALGLDKIQNGNIDQWDQMIDTNIKGVLYVTRFIVPHMEERNQGHIVNIGSISSHEVYSGGGVYCATKFAVKAISKALKMDLHGTSIRVSEIDPGAVETQFALTRFSGDTQRANQIYEGMIPLKATDIADAILFCLTCPPHVSIPSVQIYPQDQSASQMIYRRKS